MNSELQASLCFHDLDAPGRFWKDAFPPAVSERDQNLHKNKNQPCPQQHTAICKRLALSQVSILLFLRLLMNLTTKEKRPIL
ncbi:hypothetical protein INR49_028209 [Caranx melampygus]|nr:hypothetical protein INR49_028209 [Caranx melampygus]